MLRLLTTVATAILPLAAAVPLASNGAQPPAPRDDNPGCFDTSFNALAWGLEDFVYNASYLFTTPSHQNSWGYANFELSNSALTYKASCHAASSQLSDFFYGTLNYDCVMPDPEGQGTTTTFAFDYPGHKLSVNQTWSCSDADPAWPTTFRAAGSIDLDLECTDTGNVVNPDWEYGTGAFYSTRYVSCAPVSLKGLKPQELTAIA
ncbi:uncharacterized protein B0I36DRAFT_326014 [Microdochium trichocladiopsis]|uniref:AA1-like domain-containing protein n=1 Tax=Microdochium trichocladiopsis TaxID=1682393 RepID=A0A9P8Y716_9PEZI|nr:uncharacterized protein B0I36DRAFT_326014 [Microdochium trichocladiopsis]KAH7029563.1 hypothetical protein B0I36DRAFT_326014 [Microdochium trichocladiopsis]